MFNEAVAAELVPAVTTLSAPATRTQAAARARVFICRDLHQYDIELQEGGVALLASKLATRIPQCKRKTTFVTCVRIAFARFISRDPINSGPAAPARA